VELEDGRLQLSDLRGEVLGGRHWGEWRADFTAKPPVYSGSGSLERVALGQLAEAMHDGWVTGTIKATYRATTSGLSAAELFSSAEDRKSTRLNSSHGSISYAVFCLKKKKKKRK